MRILALKIADDQTGATAEKRWDLDKIKALQNAGAAFLPEIQRLEAELNAAINQRQAQAAEVAPAPKPAPKPISRVVVPKPPARTP